MKLTEKQKDNLEFVGEAVLTIGTACLAEYLVGGGTVLVINKLFEGMPMSKIQTRFLQGIVLTGTFGVGVLTAYETAPKFASMMREALSVIPTKEEEVEQDG